MLFYETKRRDLYVLVSKEILNDCLLGIWKGEDYLYKPGPGVV
jgi:hypothetical protein